MIYKITRRADQDVTEIYLYGAARYGVDQAERYHAGLVSTFELLAANPHLARERMEFRRPVRLHPYQAHMIAYTAREEDLLIVRVLHGRQDWRRHLTS